MFADATTASLGAALAPYWCYDDRMLKIRMKRNSAANAAAVTRLARIEASITELVDDDLLDLADIFLDKPDTDIARYASAEMARRKIRL